MVLYVGGGFLEQDGAPGNSIARWDGQSWHRLSGGVLLENGRQAGVNKLVPFHDNLYAAGPFIYADGIWAYCIARWDGSKWCSLGDTVSTVIMDAEVYKDELYIAGTFKAINGDSSYQYFAKWTGGDYTSACANGLSIKVPHTTSGNASLYPNPSNDKVFIDLPDVQSVSVYDILGKLLSRMENYQPTLGIDVHDLAGGVYWLRIKESNQNISVLKFVKE